MEEYQVLVPVLGNTASVPIKRGARNSKKLTDQLKFLIPKMNKEGFLTRSNTGREGEMIETENVTKPMRFALGLRPFEIHALA